MATLRQAIKATGAALVPSRTGNTGYDMFDFGVHVKNAAAGANASITIHRIYTNPFDFYLRVVSLKQSPDANVTADASNYVVHTFEKDDGAGGAKATVATLNTSNVAYTGNIAYAATLSSNNANTLLAPGASLYRTVTKTGTFTHGADMDTIRFSRADSAD
jgi:hypothetical protein